MGKGSEFEEGGRLKCSVSFKARRDLLYWPLYASDCLHQWFCCPKLTEARMSMEGFGQEKRFHKPTLISLSRPPNCKELSFILLAKLHRRRWAQCASRYDLRRTIVKRPIPISSRPAADIRVDITFVVLQMGEPEYWEYLRNRALKAPIIPDIPSPRLPGHTLKDSRDHVCKELSGRNAKPRAGYPLWGKA